MAATTSGKARLFDLVAKVMELVRDGNRDETRVADWLQKVKDDPEFDRTNGNIIPPTPFKYDKTKDGWKLIERGPIRRIADISKLKAEPFLEKGEGCVNGAVMRDRAKEKGCDFGQADLEYVLEHQDQIPKKLRGFYLVFPGTVWRDSDGDRYVAYCGWGGGRWCLYFGWLGSDWDGLDRLLSSRK